MTTIHDRLASLEADLTLIRAAVETRHEYIDADELLPALSVAAERAGMELFWLMKLPKAVLDRRAPSDDERQCAQDGESS